MLKQDCYNDFFEIGQLKINFSLFELGLPDDDPVYTLKKVMEDLDFSGLLACYSDKGRTGFNPIMLYSVVTYANMRGVRAVDRIVELCERDLAFIWLTKGQKPKRDVFYDFKGKKLTGEVLDELSYQFMRRLEKEGFITLKELYIDGTKIEANASRYTFVWRGTLNYHLAGLLDTIDTLYAEYNTFLHENGYGPRYDLGDCPYVRDRRDGESPEGHRKNRKRKITKHKKIPNNTIIEIDNCSPLEIQKLYEELEKCGSRLMEYKECFEIMGKDRNSYSKTDLEATFMRMKEDHMQNGQLKAAYNVQIAVENYFIVHSYVSNDRTDYNTLIPVLEKHRSAFGDTLETVTADSGYCSEKNLLYLKENGIRSFIKLQDHEKRKTRAYKEDIGKYYNMTYAVFEDEHYYICHDGRELRHIRTESKEQDGCTQTVEVYGCMDCGGCEHKAQCIYRYNAQKNPDRNKVMKINERWEELKEESNTNIQSEEGQTEEAEKYKEEVFHLLNQTSHTWYTENRMLNIILNEKLCHENLREARLELDIEENCLDRIREIDITTIFANLLDNAIEAI